jgi:hypothetical protein
MKLSDWLPSVFVEGDGDDIQVTTKKFSQFPTASGENIQGVGIKDGNNVKFDLTTDSIKVNPEPFRNARGQFVGTPEELADIENQRDVNNFLYQAINDIEAGEIDIPPGTIVSEDPPEDAEEGQCWYDTGRLELFVFAEDGWFPCSPLGARVDAGEALQAQILSRVEAGEEEQEQLKSKVKALEGAVGEHSLVFTMLNANVRDGEFNLKDGAMQLTNTLSSADYIGLSSTDRNGNTIDLDRITEGDVLRLADISGQAAELKIDGGTEGLFSFTQISGELDRLSDYPYDFVLLSSFDPTGLATIDYVDAQDATKIGLSGSNTIDTSWRVKSGSNTVMSGSSEGNLKIYNLSEPSDGHHAATKTYADKMIPRSGTSDLVGDWRVRQENAEGNYSTLIHGDSGQLGLYNLKDPADSHHAVPRSYVDDANADNAKKSATNTFKEVQTFQKSTYFQNSIVLNGKNTDTLAEVKGENEETRELWWKIRGTNKVSWICYPGQENRDYKRCMTMEWDVDTDKPNVTIDWLTEPTRGRHAATKQYVDEKVAEAGGGSFAQTGATTPELQAGQLFYNTTDKVLYIGE